MKRILVLIYLFYGCAISQNLEESIYVATETFMANKNEASLKTLSQKEAQFKKNIRTKDEQLAMVFLLCHKGFYLNTTSKLKDAITSFEDALKRFNDNKLSSLSDFDIIESCMKPLGNLYTKTGDFTNAESIIKQYIFLAQKNKKATHQISGAINLAKLYQSLGKHETVLKLTSNYIGNPNCTAQQKQKLMAINADSQMALGKISSTEELPAPIKEDYKYKLALQNKDYNKALDEFKKLKSKNRSEENLSGRNLAKLYVEEAQIYILLNQKEQARTSLSSALKTLIPHFNGNALPNANQLYAENTFIDIFDLYADIETQTNTALQYYDLSFYVAKLLRNNWTAQETKILHQTANRIRSEKCIELLFNAFSATKNKALIFKALQYAENSKASSLRDMFLKKQYLKQFPTDTLLQRELKLLKQQEHITGLLVKEQLGQNRVHKINQFNKELNTISLKLKALKTALLKTHPDKQTSFSLEDLQQKLQTDQATLVEYFYGKNQIYQFIVSKNKITLYRLEKRTLAEKNIVDFINLFNSPQTINNNISNYTQQAFNIYKLLNLSAVNGTKNIEIIPDGLLHFVPFDAVLTQETRSTTFSKMPFLVCTNNIAYNSSIVMYLNSLLPSTGKSVLGVFPVFENTSQALDFSKNEARVIKNEMQATILLNDNASKQNFIEQCSHYNILHLSTHAQAGNFSTPANLSFYNGNMLLNELYSLDLNPNLVVLSACETGVGKLYKSEGAMSIARGFQYAGAQNLLFSLWRINDLSTSKIMESFYKKFNKHQSAFMANSQSKIEYLNNPSISNAKKSPYYWSAFVYYGSIDPKKQGNFILYVVFGTLIVFIGLFLFLISKKRKHGRNTPTISS